MPRQNVQLPPEFARYHGQVQYVQQVSDSEWSSTCPKCGGEMHAGNEWPDRCRWFTDGKPRGWCRRCGTIFWPDDSTKPDPDALAKWRAEQLARELARKRSAELALAHLRDDRIWERYNDTLQQSGAARAWWRKRGVPDTYQDYWQLGWDALHTFGTHSTSTATIPLFGRDWQPRNIKHRLIDPGDCGKYRYQLAGQAQPAFLANPDGKERDHLIAIEGEIKAMVVHITLDDSHSQIIGLPGTNPSPDILAALAQADRVTLVMDPGAKGAGIKMAQTIGVAKVWLLETPVKVDDGILAHGMTAYDLRQMLRGAIRLSAFVKGAA